MKRLAVLISDRGTGTNLQAMIDAIESGKLAAKIAVVVSDTDKAKGLARAKKHGLKTLLVKDEALMEILTDLQPDYICLAGWKKIVPEKMIRVFKNRILNIHPGLIPDQLDGVVKNPDASLALWNRGQLAGKAIKQFLDSSCSYAGSTVHFLSSEFDFGPVLARCWEKIRADDTVDSLYHRLKKKEHQIYVESLIKLCN